MRLISLFVAAMMGSSAMAATVATKQVNLKPFELKWVNHETPGTMYKTADHPKGVFVVEAYYNQCHWCNVNAPNVEELGEAFKDNENVQVLDTSSDCRNSEYATWIANHDPKHPVLNDCQQKVLGQLGVGGFPTTVIFDCKLKEIYRTEGSWDDFTKQQIHQVVQAQIAKGCE